MVLLMLWANPWKHHNVITNDTTSYYSYLPAYFIYDDIVELQYVHQDPSRQIWVSQNEKGQRFFKMTMGLAILWLPGFLLCWLFSNPTEILYGYDWPFHLSISLSALFYSFIGLVFLHKFLRKHFSFNISTLTVLATFFASNLMHYTLVAPGMAHAYNFFLVALLLFLSRNGFKSIANALIWSFLAGLLVLIRPTNLIILPFILGLQYLLGQNLFKELLNPKLLTALLLGGLLAVSPQLIYWYKVSGNILMYSYEQEGFHFGIERLFLGIAGFRKGWLIYSPLYVALIIAPFILKKEEKKISLFLVGITLVFSAIIYSWWCWWYGGGFGSRSMVDLYPILALGIALFFKRLSALPRGVFFTLAVALNLLFTWKMVKGILHYDAMTSKAYAKLFTGENMEASDFIDPDYYGAKYLGKELHFKGKAPIQIDKSGNDVVLFQRSFTAKDSLLYPNFNLLYYNSQDRLSDTLKAVVTVKETETGKLHSWMDLQIFYNPEIKEEWIPLRVTGKVVLELDKTYSETMFIYNPKKGTAAIIPHEKL